MRYELPLEEGDGGRGGRQDAMILRTWGAAVLRPYAATECEVRRGGCGTQDAAIVRTGAQRAAPLQGSRSRSRGGSGGQRVQKVPLSQLMRLPLLVTMPLMMVPDQFVVSWWRESQEPVAVAFWLRWSGYTFGRDGE